MPAAGHDPVRVAINQADLAVRNTQQLVDDLREAGLMPLADRLGATDQSDSAVFLEPDLYVLVRRATCRLDVTGETEAPQASPRLALDPPRRPVTGEQMAPLQVLGGDEQLLRERFEVSSGGSDSFTLVPAGGDPGFRRLTLEFRSGQLSSMEIIDRLNQRVSVQFSQLDADRQLTPADFAFQPPPDADLFYYDE